jgi:hypothetical protein
MSLKINLILHLREIDYEDNFFVKTTHEEIHGIK